MCIYAHINTYMYTCGGGRELLLESIRTVPTECFNNNAQYKTILTRMQIPWKKGSLVYSSTGPYPPKNVFASIIRVLRMIPDTTSSGFPLPKWNYLKWKSKILGEAQSALQDNEVQAQMGSEVSSETPSLEAQYLILLFFLITAFRKHIVLAWFTSESDLSGKSVLGRLIIGILPTMMVCAQINRSLWIILRKKACIVFNNPQWDCVNQAVPIIRTRNTCLTCQQQNKRKPSLTHTRTYTCTNTHTSPDQNFDSIHLTPPGNELINILLQSHWMTISTKHC